MVRASFWVTLRWYDWKNREKSIFCTWFQASAAVSIRSPFFWDVTQRILMVSGHPISLVPISRPKTSVTKHQSKLREDLIIVLFELRVSGFRVKPLTPRTRSKEIRDWECNQQTIGTKKITTHAQQENLG